MRAGAGLALLAILGSSGPAWAQSRQDVETVVPPAMARAATMDLSLSSPVLPPVLDLKLEATRSDKAAALLLGAQLGGNASGHLKVSAPVDTSDETTELANLRGLADTATVELGFNSIFGALWDRPHTPAEFEELEKACLAKTGKRECELRELPTDEADRFVRWVRKPKLIALTVEGGRKGFSWRDAATLAKKEAHHTLYSAAVAFGVFPLISMRAESPLRGLYYVGVNGVYETSYKAQSKTELCTPFGAGGVLRCSDVSIGSPGKTIKAIAQLEARKYFGPNFLAIPRVSRDFRNDVTGIELPLFFIKDQKGGLNGGISLGWRSDDKSIVASVFVGHFSEIGKSKD